MGATIGGATGVLLGGFGAWRFAFILYIYLYIYFRMGLRGREALIQIGKIAAQSGGSFGVFMVDFS